MKIAFGKDPSKVQFSKLAPGDVFLYEGVVYFKVTETKIEGLNVIIDIVGAGDGHLYRMDPDSLVVLKRDAVLFVDGPHKVDG